MAKIVIGLVGTGRLAVGDSDNNRYETTDYILGGKIYKNETLTSCVISNSVKANEIYLIGTSDSMWDNVAELYCADDEYIYELIEKKDKKTLKENDLNKLSFYINKKIGGNKSKIYLVNEGKNDEELWNAFNKFMEIYNNIEEKDTVYIDITHLFRSMSVMSFVLLELLHIAKDVKLGGIYYGMFRKNGPSIIINLDIFFELLDWAKAIRNFKKYGNPMSLVEIMPKLKNENLDKIFRNFAQALSVSDVVALSQSIKILKGKLNIFKDFNNALSNLIYKDLADFINRFEKCSNDLPLFQYELAKFYAENKNYPMAYISLVEAIISKVCDLEGLNNSNNKDREKAKEEIKEYKNTPNQYIRDVFIKINSIRINIAHKTINNSNYSRTAPKDIINNLEMYLSKINPLFV